MTRSGSQFSVADAAAKSQKAERTEASEQENRSARKKEIGGHLAASLKRKHHKPFKPQHQSHYQTHGII